MDTAGKSGEHPTHLKQVSFKLFVEVCWKEMQEMYFNGNIFRKMNFTTKFFSDLCDACYTDKQAISEPVCQIILVRFSVAETFLKKKT